LLPLVFTVLHLSYGLGFLVGLAKFANRWTEKKKEKVAISPIENFIGTFEET